MVCEDIERLRKINITKHKPTIIDKQQQTKDNKTLYTDSSRVLFQLFSNLLLHF